MTNPLLDAKDQLRQDALILWKKPGVEQQGEWTRITSALAWAAENIGEATVAGPWSIKSGTHGWSQDTVWIEMWTASDMRSKQLIVVAPRSGIHSESYGDRPVLDWSEVVMVPGVEKSNHGSRLYGARGDVVRCTVSDIGKGQGTPYHDGHGLYFSIGGSVAFAQCTFQRCEGNGVQLRSKPVSGYVPPDSALIEVLSSTFIDNAMNASGSGGGAAAALCIYAGTPQGTTVLIDGCAFIHHGPAYAGPGGDGRHARGSIVVWNENGKFNEVRITDTTIHTAETDRNHVKLVGVPTVNIDGLDFRCTTLGGTAQPVIHIQKGGVEYESIEIKNCRGYGTIKIEGVGTFPLEDGYKAP